MDRGDTKPQLVAYARTPNNEEFMIAAVDVMYKRLNDSKSVVFGDLSIASSDDSIQKLSKN